MPAISISKLCIPAIFTAAPTGTLMALFLALRDRRPRLARAALWIAMERGPAFFIGRRMQGMHFLSHSRWTLLADPLPAGAVDCQTSR